MPPLNTETASPSEKMRAVFPLLLECARAHPDPGELRRLSSLCSDWNGFTESAERQEIACLVFWALNRACPEAVPPPSLAAFRNRFQRNVARNFLYTKEIFRILDLFRPAGIEVLSFKGPALAWTLYETPGMRHISDLDLLVSRGDIDRALDLLVQSGHRRKDSIGLRFLFDCGQLVLHRAGETFEIDLHWRLAAAHFNPLDIAEIRARLTSIEIAGRRTPAFSPEDLLAFLCVHGSKHGWPSLAKLCDLDRLIDAGGLDWDAVLSRATGRRMTRMVSLSLCLAQDLLGSNLPPEISRRVHADARAMAMAASVRARLQEGRGWSMRELAVLTFQLTEGLRGKLRFLWYYLHPTPRDWKFLGIPESMFPLYYLTRPIRLAWRWCLEPHLTRGRRASALWL